MNASATSDNSEKVSFRSWMAVLGALLGAFMAVLDIQITNASLNDILGSLGATYDEGGWISTAYLVAEIIVIPLTGWLTLVFGTRRYLAVNAGLFLLASVACAFAWDLNSMILFRALQGFTGGVLIPVAFSVILKTLPLSKQPVGFALFGLTATFAPAIGPTIGGWLTTHYGWPSIFYMNLLPGVALIGMILYSLDAEPMQLTRLRKGDYAGIVTMAIGLGSLTIFLEEGNKHDWFASAMITRLAVTAMVSLTAFVVIELWSKEPFINLRLLGRRNFGLGSIVNMALGLALYGSGFILPLYLAQIQGYNSMQIGEVIMWTGVPQLFIILFIPTLMKKVDGRVLITIGILCFSVSGLMNGFMSHLTAIDQLKWSQLVRAFGFPLILTPLTALTTGNIEKSQTGSASSLFSMMRNLGGSMGIALLGMLLTRREGFHSARIGESITLFDAATQQRLDQLTQNFIAHGSDAVMAGQQALASLANIVRRDAFVMAYNDAFLFMGALLFVSGAAVWFTKRVVVKGTVAGH